MTSATVTLISFLACPECGEDAVPSFVMGCRDCENGDHDRSTSCVLEPTWTEGDGCQCPACGTDLRVVVDDGHAYAEVAA